MTLVVEPPKEHSDLGFWTWFLSPSHTVEPVHLQTDLLVVFPQRSHFHVRVVDRPSWVEVHRTAADRSPEPTQNRNQNKHN